MMYLLRTYTQIGQQRLSVKFLSWAASLFFKLRQCFSKYYEPPEETFAKRSVFVGNSFIAQDFRLSGFHNGYYIDWHLISM